MKLDYTYGEIHTILTGESLKDSDSIQFVAYDTRSLIDGNNVLFFALKGGFRDGSDFIVEAYDKGVRHFVTETNVNFALPGAKFINVPNSLFALQKLAESHRKRFTYPVIAVTGSNGKTIVKEWLSDILAVDYRVVKSPKSYNSQLGVAISLLEMNKEADIAIIEAGISQPGEMQKLKQMIAPTIGVLTNIGSAHLENFSSKKELEKEKKILFDECEQIISGEGIEWQDEARVVFADTKITQRFNSPFDDPVSNYNLSIAITAAKSLGIQDSRIEERIRTLSSVSMRLERFDGINGNTIINDTYSLDDEALRNSLQYQFALAGVEKKRVVIIGLEEKNSPKEQHYSGIIDAFGPVEHYFYYPGRPFDHEFNDAVILIKGERNAQMQKLASSLKLRTHSTYLEIDLDAIRNNIQTFKSKLNKNTQLLCMVKASSYGSDATKIGVFLERLGVDYLGVAYVDEGVELRRSGVNCPIMVMNVDEFSFQQCIEFYLEPAIYSFKQLDSFVKELIGQGRRNYPVHIKFDTGMNRLGFVEDDLESLKAYLLSQPEVYPKSVYSHLATADEPESPHTLEQINQFKRMSNELVKAFHYPVMRHILNSEGIANYSNAQFDLVRLGIGMYGISKNKAMSERLVPVLRWHSVVSQIKHLKPGDAVGYNRRFIADKPTVSATIPVGYADGFRRSLSGGKGGVYIHGKYCPTLGTVCMDMLMVDVTGLEVTEGDAVEIIGNHQSLEQYAAAMQTISYEAMTGFSSRLPRVYING